MTRILLWMVLLALFIPTESRAYLYLFQHYTEQVGLVNNAVNGMAQDQEGLVWFSTRGGVVRYDGQDWVAHGLEEGLQAKEFSHISLGPEGRLWVAAKRVPFSVSYLEEGTWESITIPPIPRINGHAILFEVGQDASGDLLVCVAAQGGPLCFYSHGQWQFIVDGYLTGNINGHILVDGHLLIGAQSGLFRVDPGNLTVIRDPYPEVPAGPIFALAHEAKTGKQWLAGEGWIGTLDGGHFEYVAEGLDFNTTQIWNRTGSLVGSQGGFYFGGISRSYRYGPNSGLEELGGHSGRKSPGSTGFFEDREGTVWITSLRGVSKLVSRRFAGLDRSLGLYQDEVSAILEDSRGRIILGHEGGLTILEPEPRLVPFNLESDRLGRVMGLVEDRSGNIWAATDGKGMLRISPRGNFRWYGPDEGISERVFTVHLDEQDRIWAGTFGGLAYMENDRFVPVPLPNQKRDDTPFVRKIFQASDGSFYLATGRDGVIRYHRGDVQQWSGDGFASGNSTFAVLETADKRIWVGTAVGLFAIEGDTLTMTQAPDPVITRPIYSMLEDAQGQTWFGTDAGVYLWNGDHMRHFTVDHGLIGSEVNRAALILESNNRVWIGTDRGASLYRPEADLPTTALPNLEILAFEVDGKTYPADQPLQLESPPRTFFVHFRGVSFIDEKNMGFRTWLENFEPDWGPFSPHPIYEVRYTNLQAGRYHFHVQVKNSDGITSNIAVSPEIHIKRPVLQRWWAILLVGLMVALAAFVTISFWEGKRYARRLENEVQSRTQELEASEKAMRRESQRLSATLGSILDGVLALDAENRVVLCNPAAEFILNRSASEMVGLLFGEAMPLVGHQAETEAQNSWKWSCQDRLECSQRGTICLEISSSPITDRQGQRTGSVVAFSDITDRLRMERELIRSQKLESLGLLAGGIAHDFNNLLTIMLGNIDLVESSPRLDEIDRESLLLAKQASSRARGLTGQLLTFARGGAPRRQLASLADIIEQSVALSFSGLNIRCQLDLPSDLWFADVDHGQMGQVFNNLFINASQAMPEGGVVQVRAENLHRAPESLASGQWVKVEVQDEGSGISEQNLVRIFDPYFTTKNEGSGLGLATAYSIISRHGGRLRVESQEGQGATFILYLPRGVGETEHDSQDDLFMPPQGRRVLVLEDEPGIQALFEMHLKKMGQECVITSRGEETLAEYERGLRGGKPFDLVVTDLTIPGGMGGKRTMEGLLKLDPQVKAVVVSGYSEMDILANPTQFGFCAALAKPFSFEELARILGQALA